MNLATSVTVFRILLAPVFAWVIYQARNGSTALLWAALALAILSEISDGLDGWLARRLGQVSDLGKLLDPLADSLARMTSFLAFTAVGWMSLGVMLVLIWRDILVSAIRTAAASQGLVLAARSSGKIKAIVQAAAIFAVLLAQLAHGYNLNWGFSWLWFQNLFVWAAALITAWSLADYAYSCRAAFRALARR